MVNSPMKPNAYSIGVSKETDPLYMVAVQLNTLIAEGTATRKLSNEKTMLGVHGLAGHEHVMSPDQETEYRDRHAGERDEAIAENALSREAGDDLADHAHAGQNHDVHGRMRVKPEQMLEQNRDRRRYSGRRCRRGHALKRQQEQRDGDDRRSEHLNQAGGVVRPDEQRQTAPGHARRAHLVDRDDEV